MLAEDTNLSGPRNTYFYHTELERHAVHSVDFVLEVEYVDKLICFSGLLILGHALGEYLRVLVQIQNRVVSQGFSVETVGTSLVDTYPATLFFVCDLRLGDQCLYQVFNSTSLRDQQIVLLLKKNF